jgi:EAL and modified HD-GYP domain-containing signal transduction protein
VFATDQHSQPPSGGQVTVERVVARQPIIGLGDRVVGFQLLQRPTTEAPSDLADADETITLSSLLGEASFDIDLLFGGTQLFYRPGPGLFTTTGRVSRSVRQTVLEVPAELGTDPEAVARCGVLWAAGYSIAAQLSDWRPGVEPLLRLADFVSIDVASVPRDRVVDLVARCAPYDVTPLATSCLTEEDLVWARNAGFLLFQGPAVVHPVGISGQTLAPSALARVQLASELLDERLDFGRVEEILAHEPALVVQVLHLASLGAGGGLRREVRSIREALVLMGTQRLRQWAALLVLGRQVSKSRTDALGVALVRARMCELLADRAGIERGFAFTAGLLSAMDRLLGVPLAEVEAKVDVDHSLSSAAFRHEGMVGKVVALVSDYQDAVATGAPIDPELGDVELIGAMAFAWAISHVRAIERTPR